MSLYGYQKKTKPALYMQHFAPPVRSVKRPTPRQPRQTRIRAISKIKATDKRRYRARVAVWLTEAGNNSCHACPKIQSWWTGKELVQINIATQCHHKHGRGWNGELLMYESLWIPVCSGCHNFIHNNPSDARRVGLYAPEGKWNEMP